MVARRILSGGARLPDAIKDGAQLTTHAGSRARRLDRVPVRVRYAFDGQPKPFARFSFAWLNERELPEAVRRMAAARA